MDAILQVRIYELSIFGTRDAWRFCEIVRRGAKETAVAFHIGREPLFRAAVLSRSVGRARDPWNHLVMPVNGESIWM